MVNHGLPVWVTNHGLPVDVTGAPYSVISGLPFITVSPVGTSSGYSFNNGANFGPDTPGTTTDGVAEAYAQFESTGLPILIIPPGIDQLIITPVGQGVTYVIDNYYHYTDSTAMTVPQGRFFFDVEAVCSGATGNKVGVYSALRSATGNNIWGANPLVQADSGFTGQAIGIEVDLNNNSADTDFIWGMLINGTSSYKPNAAIVIEHQDETYDTGIQIDNSDYGIVVAAPTDQAFEVDNADNSATYFSISPSGSIGTIDGQSTVGPAGVGVVVASAKGSYSSSSATVCSYAVPAAQDESILFSCDLFIGSLSSGTVSVKVEYTSGTDDNDYTQYFFFTYGTSGPTATPGSTGDWMGMAFKARCKAGTNVNIYVVPSATTGSGNAFGTMVWVG